MNKRLLKKIGFTILGIALFALIVANRRGLFEARSYQDKGTLIPVTSESRWSEGAIPVHLGVYVEKVYDFTIQSQAFSAEGRVWLIWPREFQDLLTARNIPIGEILNVMNLLQTTNFTFTPEGDAPTRLPDGRYCQTFRYYGKFYAKGLDFRRFPFEVITFPMTFGLNPKHPFLNVEHVRLVPDSHQSGLGEYADIPGYVLTGRQLNEYIYEFQTKFGLPMDDVVTENQFSRLQMEVIYHTSVIAAFLQLFLPLVVVMAVVLLAPNLAGSLWDVRVALPSTALLTLIFLQQGYRSQLPSLPYLTFIDQVYTICYAISLVVFALFVWSSNLLDEAPETDRSAVIRRINQIDRRFQIWLTIALVILVCLSWFFPVR